MYRLLSSSFCVLFIVFGVIALEPVPQDKGKIRARRHPGSPAEKQRFHGEQPRRL
jgi:hypothetical protein